MKFRCATVTENSEVLGVAGKEEMCRVLKRYWKSGSLSFLTYFVNCVNVTYCVNTKHCVSFFYLGHDII